MIHNENNNNTNTTYDNNNYNSNSNNNINNNNNNNNNNSIFLNHHHSQSYNDLETDFFAPQFPKTVRTLTKLEKGEAVFMRSTQMVQGSLMCSVTKQQPEGDGWCSRRDRTDWWISTETGPSINVALEI